MNFVGSGSLARCGLVTSWTVPCCRDILKIAASRNIIDDRQKQTPCKKKMADGLQIKVCTSNLRMTSGLALWTQVRFQKECPRLHRDIEYPNFDFYRKDQYKDIRKTTWGQGDSKPGYTYVLGFFGLLAGTYGLKSDIIHYALSMAAAADVLALAKIEVEIGGIKPGGCLSIKWRGKPLFVKNRTAAERELENRTPMSALKDPQTEEQRTIKPQWLIVLGICTHLGCVPIPDAGDFSGGFYCPCHGSHYDNLGRARKGPAPTNLEIPLYSFISDDLIVVG